MEPLLKCRFLKLCDRAGSRRRHRTVTTLLLVLLGLFLTLGVQQLFIEKVIGTESKTTELICSRTPSLSPEELSREGKDSYNKAQFDSARDCWQKAATAYRQQGKETEAINNQINQSQAELALGLYPRAYNTLLQIYNLKDCTSLPQQMEGCTTLSRDEEQRKQYIDNINKQADSPTKISGLRNLGTVLRELGELDLSNQVFLLSLQKAQPQEQAAIWLDLGNTRRALSSKEQDLYSRSQQLDNFICAVVFGYEANNAYQKAVAQYSSVNQPQETRFLRSMQLLTEPYSVINEASSNRDTLSRVNLQAQLNHLSFGLDLEDWRKKINKQSKSNNDIFTQLFQQSNLLVLRLKVDNCWKQLNSPSLVPSVREIPPAPSISTIRTWLNQQLLNQNPLINSKINNLQQQIEQLPLNHTSLYTRLNFAKSLMRLPNIDFPRVVAFLNETVNLAKVQGNRQAESYALGYLGKIYLDNEQWELAKTKTQQALLLAQSIPSLEITYQWQWQLGRIYKPKSTQRVQGKANQDNLKDLEEARKAYAGAFKALQSLRQELATSSSDIQSFFLEQVEDFYGEYVDVLLWDGEPEPTQENLSQAREVITSFQAVELENFLRQSCPENTVERIDKIIDEQSKSAAFIYPIVLDNRIEIILKLPTPSNQKQMLKHFRKSIAQDEVEELVAQFQLDLEEEYTFEDVFQKGKTMYQWFVEDIDKAVEKYNSNSLSNVNTLVFALDTNLQNIPFAALVYDGTLDSPKYLIDKYAIALAPRLELPTPNVLQDRKLKILVAGLTEPELTVQQKRQFSKLRYVDDELEKLEGFEKSNSRVSVTKLSNKNFNFKEFESEIKSTSFQILHLATHGEFSSSPDNTFILAYDQVIPVNQFGSIFQTQAQNQLEPIELLVMSACETAAGDKRATLGISGVSVRAGARSAIASLWTIDDKISVEFAEQLYNQLIKNSQQTKAQALQKAQIELKRSPEREHPRYWAPYILLGNWL
ncbi:MAG: CHAT domain-containing protein [Scytonema sp. PMC 1069.18]|nr:CHAT domain-containing protein [Scytonema sp. PMC 1069.18]MEC4883863.1 CHAT domain-containing protein [Scytonema sp. PMC 1070.18]